MEAITSAKNPKIRLWKALRTAKGRAETGCMLLEGGKLVGEARAEGCVFRALLLTEERRGEVKEWESLCPVFLLTDALMKTVCETMTPQGIAAVIDLPERGSSLAQARRLVVLDDVQDPGNVGTILRTADAAGFDGALLSRGCADPWSPKAVRATMGSLFHIGIAVTDDLPGALAEMRGEGVEILCGQLDGETIRLGHNGLGNRRLAVIIGNEGNGVSAAVRAQATRAVRLPMRGRAESLNAAVAAGILMYWAMEEEGGD